MIAALACELPAPLAAVAGVHIHSMSGLRWARKNGSDRGMLASEIADAVPSVLADLQAGLELSETENLRPSVIPSA
jgi:NAD(P)H-hydrate epimerase